MKLRSPPRLIALAMVPWMCLALAAAGQDTAPREDGKLIVGISDQPPFCMRDSSGAWCGITVDLWKHVADRLGFDYEFQESDLAGMVRGLDERTYDLEVCPAFITAIGEEHVDFSAPYFVDDTAVAINADRQPTFRQAALGMLSSGPFLLLIAGVALLTVAGAFVLWLLENRGTSEHYKGKTAAAFLKSLYWSLSLVVGRDFPSAVGYKAAAPDTRWGRAFGVAWMITGVVVFSMFTASAASLLTSRQLQSFVSEWNDLERLRVGTVEQSDAQEYLRASGIDSTGYPTPLALLEELRQRRIDAAVFGRAGLVYYSKTQFRNKIVVLPLVSPRSCMGLPMLLESPLRKRINREILEFTESKGWPEILAKYQD